MRISCFLLAVVLTGLAAPTLAQAPETRPRVGVIVVTLDQVRQIQAQYGRSALDSLGSADWGRFDLVDSALAPELFESCEDDRAGRRLDYCIRFYLTRAELPADAPPTVVVAFDDRAPGTQDPHGARMSVSCYGRGVVPADAEAQDTWLWPGAARMHGLNDWQRDRDALEACITAAASEPWTGLKRPDPS